MMKLKRAEPGSGWRKKTKRWSIEIRRGVILWQEEFIGPDDYVKPRDKPYSWNDLTLWAARGGFERPRPTWFAGDKRAWECRIHRLWIFVRFVDILRLHYYDRRVDISIIYRKKGV